MITNCFKSLKMVRNDKRNILNCIQYAMKFNFFQIFHFGPKLLHKLEIIQNFQKDKKKIFQKRFNWHNSIDGLKWFIFIKWINIAQYSRKCTTFLKYILKPLSFYMNNVCEEFAPYLF